MNFQFEKRFQHDLIALRRHDVKLNYKVWELLFDILRDPQNGLGKPEQLKGNLTGFWSRRIDQEHRLVYEIQDDLLILRSCYGHYED